MSVNHRPVEAILTGLAKTSASVKGKVADSTSHQPIDTNPPVVIAPPTIDSRDAHIAKLETELAQLKTRESETYGLYMDERNARIIADRNHADAERITLSKIQELTDKINQYEQAYDRTKAVMQGKYGLPTISQLELQNRIAYLEGKVAERPAIEELQAANTALEKKLCQLEEEKVPVLRNLRRDLDSAIAVITNLRDENSHLRTQLTNLDTENTGLLAEIMSKEDELDQADAANQEESDLQDFHIEDQNATIHNLYHWIAQQDATIGFLQYNNQMMMWDILRIMVPRVVRVQRFVRRIFALRTQRTRIMHGSILKTMVACDVSNGHIRDYISLFAPTVEEHTVLPTTAEHTVLPTAAEYTVAPVVVPVSIATPVVGSNAWIVARIEEILAKNPDLVTMLKKHHAVFAKIPNNEICGTCFSSISNINEKKKAQAYMLKAIVSGQIREYVEKCEHRLKLVGLPGNFGALDYFIAFYPEKLQKVSGAIWHQKHHTDTARTTAHAAARTTAPATARTTARAAPADEASIRVIAYGPVRFEQRTPRPPQKGPDLA